MGERLNRVRDSKDEYTRLLARVEELEALATRITPVLSDMPKGGSSTTDGKWARLIDYKAQLADKLNKYLRDCMELEQELDCIHNSRIKTAMKYRYVDCMKVEEIAEVMEADLRYVYRMLKKGKEIYEHNVR